ncbi:hypothetical protein SAMN05660330_03430, partial [Desulforhopalus singaporensis]
CDNRHGAPAVCPSLRDRRKVLDYGLSVKNKMIFFFNYVIPVEFKLSYAYKHLIYRINKLPMSHYDMTW